MTEDGVACVLRTAIWPTAAMSTHHSWFWTQCKLRAQCCEPVDRWEDRSILLLDRPSAYTQSLPSSALCQILLVQSESCHVRLLILAWIRLPVCPKMGPLITWTSKLTCLTALTTQRELWSTFWTTGRPWSPHMPYHRSQLKKQLPLSTKRSVTLIRFAFKQSKRAMI